MNVSLARTVFWHVGFLRDVCWIGDWYLSLGWFVLAGNVPSSRRA
jgi:hypothetical protein